jgi:hypothetical protein
MTLQELQAKLGEQIELLTMDGVTYAKRKADQENAMVIASLAKQMINNADVVLRSEKLIGDGKMKESMVMQMIGKKG